MSGFASICLLSFNRPRFVRECIASMRDAGAPFELIVHDDGSSDHQLLGLLYELVEQGVISTLMLNPPGHNQGQGVALNRMFHAAQGDPIIKVDQDLVFQPGWLARVNEILQLNSSRRAIEPEIEPAIGLLGLFHYHHDPVDSALTIRATHQGWQEHSHICGSGFAMTRDAWEALGPFDQHSKAFAEDWAMQQAVTNSGLCVCALPPDDLVVNQGFGIGPSTVVVGEGQVQEIHKSPLIHGGNP